MDADKESMVIKLTTARTDLVKFSQISRGQAFIEDRDGTEILFRKIFPITGEDGKQFNAVKLNVVDSRPHSNFDVDEMVKPIAVKEIIVAPQP